MIGHPRQTDPRHPSDERLDQPGGVIANRRHRVFGMHHSLVALHAGQRQARFSVDDSSQLAHRLDGTTASAPAFDAQLDQYLEGQAALVEEAPQARALSSPSTTQ